MTTAASDGSLARLRRNLRLGGGWYALYPPPRAFQAFGDDRFIAAIRESNGDPIPPQLALHFDIPAAYRSSFCHPDSRPRGADGSRAEAYRDRLVREVGLVGSLFDRDRDVVQVSLAPGMTRWMSVAQVAELLASLRRHFHADRAADIDLAMTLDPDDLASAPLRDWAALGFNRVGINIAALAGAGAAPSRQREDVARLVAQAREAGFANLRVEVPYGLAGQTDAAFDALVAAVAAARPERVGLRHCPSQDAPDAGATPAGHDAHARMLLASADALERAGYLHVGVDLFAQADDPLVRAQRQGRIHRDALGFGAHAATHLVGFGVGAISQLGGCHAQNPLDQPSWEARIDRGHRACNRGVELSEDDHLRAAVLQDILCYGRIGVAQLEAHHRIPFRAYFGDALARLQPLFEDGSLCWDGDAILLDRIARLAAQAIASQFDPLTGATAGGTA